MIRPALTKAQKALIPFDIYLKTASAEVREDFDPKYAPNDSGFQLMHTVQDGVLRFEITDEKNLEDKADVIRFRIDTGLRFTANDLSDGEKDPDVIAELTASWNVEYRVLSEQELDDEALQEFGQKNVLLHVWPYWREFIHTTCARFRLPQIVLPLYLLQPDASPTKDGKLTGE